MTILKMAFHSATGRRIVEVCDDRGSLVAVIYPSDDGSNTIKIVSDHIKRTVEDSGATSFPPVPAVVIKFRGQE